jgi:hypothetical protein
MTRRTKQSVKQEEILEAIGVNILDLAHSALEAEKGAQKHWDRTELVDRQFSAQYPVTDCEAEDILVAKEKILKLLKTKNFLWRENSKILRKVRRLQNKVDLLSGKGQLPANISCVRREGMSLTRSRKSNDDLIQSPHLNFISFGEDE